MSKSTPYRRFGKLLTEGIKRLDRQKPLVIVQEELANKLGYSLSMIYAWRRGEHLPDPDIIEQLAGIFVKRGQATPLWINDFLKKGAYGSPQAAEVFSKKLFGKRALSHEIDQHSPPEQPQVPEQAQPKTEALPPPFIQSWHYNANSTVASVAVSGDGKTVIATTLSKTVLALDKVGQPRWEVKVGNQVWCSAISADGQIIIVGTGSTRPWDRGGRGLYCFANDGALQWQVDLQASVWGLAVAADGNTIAAGTDGKQLILFDRRGNRLWQQDIPGLPPYALVWSTALSFDGQIVVAGAADKQLRLFERSGTILAKHQARGDVFSVDVSHDGEAIVAGDSASYVYWLNRYGSLLWQEQLADKVWAVAVSSNGTRLLVGVGEKEAHIRTYDQAGRLLWRRYVGGSVSNLALSTNGQRVVVGTRNGDIYIFGEDGFVLHHTQVGMLIRDVALSGTGEQIVAGSKDGYVYGFRLPIVSSETATLPAEFPLPQQSATAPDIHVEQIMLTTPTIQNHVSLPGDADNEASTPDDLIKRLR